MFSADHGLNGGRPIAVMVLPSQSGRVREGFAQALVRRAVSTMTGGRFEHRELLP